MAKNVTNPSDDPDAAQVRMSFGEHLEELRKRIIRALLGSLVLVAVCLVYYKEIIAIVSRPYILIARAHHLPDVLNTLKPQEAFLTSVTLAFQVGLLLSSPWIIYQLWQFVAAGLFPRERTIVYRYTGPSAILFLTGVAFFYLIVLPMTLNFFMTFTDNTAPPPPTPNFIERLRGIKNPTPAAAAPATAASQPAAIPTTLPVLTADPARPADGQIFIYQDARDGRLKIRTSDAIFAVSVTQQGSLFSTTWRYDDYLSFVMFTALVFGLAFELPMVIMILARVGLVQIKTFRSIRKYAYFAIVIIAAIAAPSGDPATLALLAVPLILLYEVGIVAAAVVTREKARK
jgi:sec-independent protein translocase protein TatC